MGTGTPVTEDEIITPEKMNLKLESSPDNALRGILGVASGWGTDPTNLANATDGDIDTVTGTGEKVMGGSGNYGIITFDLGSVKTVMVGGRFGLWGTAGTQYIFPETSDDNITWHSAWYEMIRRAAVAEQISESYFMFMAGRYIRLRFYTNIASTAYAKIYEVMAWELTI